MTVRVFIDTGVLGLLTHPGESEASRACTNWMIELLEAGAEVFIPEVCDYELRREYLRTNRQRALERLENLANTLKYVPISTADMRNAARMWAEARQRGRPTASSQALDIDVILAAQALDADKDAYVATVDVQDLSQFVRARTWDAIPDDPTELD